MIPNVLSIAGSDPSGGAGIQADLKAFTGLGCYGMAAMTALTAQNTMGVQGVHVVPAAFLEQQIRSIFDDIDVAAVKIGLVTADAIPVIAGALEDYAPAHIVLDPVMVASSGDTLLPEEVIAALMSDLMPLASVVTPNIPEARILAGLPEESDQDALARAILDKGARSVLVKGGHGDGAVARDVLLEGEARHVFEVPRIETRNTHGTGCTLSSSIAAYLAQGEVLPTAVQKAKDFVTQAIASADQLNVGSGHGPLNHTCRNPRS